MIEFLEQRITTMLKHPNVWGEPHAVELQLILLIECWHVAREKPLEWVDLTQNRFISFIQAAVPHSAPIPLSHRLCLDQRASNEFIALLTSFWLIEKNK